MKYFPLILICAVLIQRMPSLKTSKNSQSSKTKLAMAKTPLKLDFSNNVKTPLVATSEDKIKSTGISVKKNNAGSSPNRKLPSHTTDALRKVDLYQGKPNVTTQVNNLKNGAYQEMTNPGPQLQPLGADSSSSDCNKTDLGVSQLPKRTDLPSQASEIEPDANALKGLLGHFLTKMAQESRPDSAIDFDSPLKSHKIMKTTTIIKRVPSVKLNLDLGTPDPQPLDWNLLSNPQKIVLDKFGSSPADSSGQANFLQQTQLLPGMGIHSHQMFRQFESKLPIFSPPGLMTNSPLPSLGRSQDSNGPKTTKIEIKITTSPNRKQTSQANLVNRMIQSILRGSIQPSLPVSRFKTHMEQKSFRIPAPSFKSPDLDNILKSLLSNPQVSKHLKTTSTKTIISTPLLARPSQPNKQTYLKNESPESLMQGLLDNLESHAQQSSSLKTSIMANKRKLKQKKIKLKKHKAKKRKLFQKEQSFISELNRLDDKEKSLNSFKKKYSKYLEGLKKLYGKTSSEFKNILNEEEFVSKALVNKDSLKTFLIKDLKKIQAKLKTKRKLKKEIKK